MYAPSTVPPLTRSSPVSCTPASRTMLTSTDRPDTVVYDLTDRKCLGEENVTVPGPGRTGAVYRPALSVTRAENPNCPLTTTLTPASGPAASLTVPLTRPAGSRSALIPVTAPPSATRTTVACSNAAA